MAEERVPTVEQVARPDGGSARLRAALAEAEEARVHLRLLAEATMQMTAALDVADTCERLARGLVPHLVDLCAVDVLDDSLGIPAPRRMAVAARDVADEKLLLAIGDTHRTHWANGSPKGRARGAPMNVREVLAGDRPVLVPEMPERGVERFPDDPVAAAIYDDLRPRSGIVVPVRARGSTIGALTFVTQHPFGRGLGNRDLHLATDIAGRAGLAIDNARLYEREHAAAATLQQSLLPRVRRVAGAEAAARYRPGVDGNQVGGDWYDVVDLADGALGLAIGDVVGHDLNAAAAMGQLRAVLRSYAWDGGSPGSVLDRCDQLVQSLEMGAMATAVYVRVEPACADGYRELRYANAGHPAPLVVGADGVRRLDQQRSPMIGAIRSLGSRTGAHRAEASLRCPPGTLLLFFTDGLTDAVGEDADSREDLVAATVAAMPATASPDEVVDRVLTTCAPERLCDDVALLAVRLT